MDPEASFFSRRQENVQASYTLCTYIIPKHSPLRSVGSESDLRRSNLSDVIPPADGSTMTLSLLPLPIMPEVVQKEHNVAPPDWSPFLERLPSLRDDLRAANSALNELEVEHKLGRTAYSAAAHQVLEAASARSGMSTHLGFFQPLHSSFRVPSEFIGELYQAIYERGRDDAMNDRSPASPPELDELYSMSTQAASRTMAKLHVKREAARLRLEYVAKQRDAAQQKMWQVQAKIDFLEEYAQVKRKRSGDISKFRGNSPTDERPKSSNISCATGLNASSSATMSEQELQPRSIPTAAGGVADDGPPPKRLRMMP
ncbi:hypothetical protein BKA62DRAFT_714003 [Auriculariales sp. MPI-PUGE-AT-0066]|nr:hypothetical protein BKA62DRAFT_714003 [Auriculariales sp. MPI-PUGE-AT-0066]